VNLQMSFVSPPRKLSGKGVGPVGLYQCDTIILVAPLAMRFARTVFRRRRLCFPAVALAALENFGPTRLRYSPRQLVLQPISPSSRLQVEHDAPVRDSVSFWVFFQPMQ